MAENTLTVRPDVTVTVTMPPELAFHVPNVYDALAGMSRLPNLHEYAVLLDLAQLVAQALGGTEVLEPPGSLSPLSDRLP